MLRSSLFLFFTLSLCTCGSAQEVNKLWTEKDRNQYAHRNDDPARWDTTMLREDLEWHLEPPNWPTQAAISDIPSPVADYDWGYCALRGVEATIGQKKIRGYNVAYAKDSFRLTDFPDPTAYYQSYFTILVLTDWPQSANQAAHIVSRNYPHYLATGKFRTSTGDLDWVQMNMASGQNFAIVSQRYFDLRFGSTLLVAQQIDGSLRFRQLEQSPGKVMLDGSVPGLEDYLKTLATDSATQAFFNHPRAVSGQ